MPRVLPLRLGDGEQEPDGAPGFVYLMGAAGGQRAFVKIGKSIQPRKRLGAVQLMSPLPLALLWYQDFGEHWCWRAESALHYWFRLFRKHGEWFDLGPVPLALFRLGLEQLAGELRPGVPIPGTYSPSPPDIVARLAGSWQTIEVPARDQEAAERWLETQTQLPARRAPDPVAPPPPSRRTYNPATGSWTELL